MREGASCGFGSVQSTERFCNMLLILKRWQSVMKNKMYSVFVKSLITGFLKVYERIHINIICIHGLVWIR